ncbi:MAG: hypothetical protein ACOY4D_10850 [Pseudomonadota bacterium]
MHYSGIVEELEHPDIAWDILSALHERAEHYSKLPKPLKQGNVQTPIGVYTCEVWKVLNSADITIMREASRIVADLLIATIPQYNTHDRNTLAESCYQIIRERNKISWD